MFLSKLHRYISIHAFSVNCIHDIDCLSKECNIKIHLPSQIRILSYYKCVVTVWKEMQGWLTNDHMLHPGPFPYCLCNRTWAFLSWSVTTIPMWMSICPFYKSAHLCVCFYAVTGRQSHQNYLHSISYRVIHASVTFHQPWGVCVCPCGLWWCRYMHVTHPIILA